MSVLAMRKPWQIGIQDFFGEHRFLIAFFAYHARDGRHLEVQSRGFEANEWRRALEIFAEVKALNLILSGLSSFFKLVANFGYKLADHYFFVC